MKVLHVNTLDTGGAATACFRIHLGLLKKGVDSKVLVLRKKRNVEETYSFMPDKKNSLVSRILLNSHLKKINKRRDKLLNNFRHKFEVFSFPTSIYDITNHPLYKEADIIQLNWISGFVDEPSFFRKNTKPVVWRMPDLYACGGGYHYETDFPFNELAPVLKDNAEKRANSLRNKNIVFVPISQWVKRKADDSTLIKDFRKVVIHNGIDINTFKPMDVSFSRTLFGIPLNKKVILFGAESLTNKRKGLDLLLGALEKISSSDVCLCVFGDNADGFPNNENVIKIGKIHDERLLALLYSSADLFVLPSIEEAFGQVSIEALACGTPVVSFSTGGSLDIIKDQFNGVLTESFTADALAKAIMTGLEFSFDRDMIRLDTMNRFNIEDKVNEYIALYRSLLQGAS